ncbi:unnamed protein product [Fraxinus pennsylvanica]|uniref:Uncharacterized protein n=1 Tax=Fraxinus pennsylvanica TaxID=56036 RepID=A0AAD2E555_9LAMI|nr:unnamed protein product [Fraxinus pennsylvanica]
MADRSIGGDKEVGEVTVPIHELYQNVNSNLGEEKVVEYQLSVQEFPANSSVMDLLERAGQGSFRWTPYGFPLKEELRPWLNHEQVNDPTCKLKMGDVIELTPPIPDKSLTKCREEIQRMYNCGVTISSTVLAASRPSTMGSLIS